MEKHIASLLVNVSFFTLIDNVDDDRTSLLARLSPTWARNVVVYYNLEPLRTFCLGRFFDM